MHVLTLKQFSVGASSEGNRSRRDPKPKQAGDAERNQERDGGLGSLLFPSSRSEKESMIRDVRKALNHIGTRVGFPKGHIRLHMLRHTCTAARLQTCDRGCPVAIYTVARELGHSGTDMLEDRYGHVHDRTEEGGTEDVEFRVEHHRVELPAPAGTSDQHSRGEKRFS